jgi:hypothetical protein
LERPKDPRLLTPNAGRHAGLRKEQSLKRAAAGSCVSADYSKRAFVA